jgi:tRNA modification GTPase
LHGGAAVISGVSDALIEFGLRPAEPGEFTRRAFLNDRIDLTEAEAVADLIEAETESQRIQALRQLGGGLSTILAVWSQRLLGLMAHQEALVDFPDEDLPEDVETTLLFELDSLRSELRTHLDDEGRGERLRSGITVVVAGPPNVGKSSLVNYLSGRDVAIVSPIPGTTRDLIEARLVIAGVPVTLVDTAGLRDTDDSIEAEGVRRAIARLADAEIVLRLRDTSDGETTDPRNGFLAEACFEARCESGPPTVSPVVIDVLTKIDKQPAGLRDRHRLAISVVTGEGMPALTSLLEREISRLTNAAGQAPLTRARHRAALKEALVNLDAARETSAEFRAENLRLALRSFGRVTGRVGVETILGQIFSQFCIGK